MPYVGNKPVNNFVSFAKQNITGNGGTSYSLDYAVTGANDIELFINNVRQEPTEAYSASGATLTLTGAISSTDDVYVIFRGRALQTAQHPADSALEASQATISGTVSIGGDVDISNTSRYYIDTKQTYVIATAMNPSGSSRVVNYVDATDHRFQTGGVDRLSVDSAGRVTKPYHPAFRARLGSVINNPNGQVIAFTVSEFDTGSNYSTSTYRYTAPVAGKYFFGVRFYASIRAGGLRVLHNHWRVNGSNVLDATMGGGTGGDGGYSAHPTIHDTCILSLNANDYVEFYNASRSSTGNFDFENGYFYGHLIG